VALGEGYGAVMKEADENRPRCEGRVPPQLFGGNGLRSEDRPRCKREPHQGGKCRAWRFLKGVGVTTWEWKKKNVGVVKGPPVVKLETPTQRLKREVNCPCSRSELVHQEGCDFSGLVMSSSKVWTR
jgi:hypothetical protein